MPNTGSHIDWSSDDLDRLSTVTMDEVAQARAWWRQRCKPRDRALLETGSDDARRNQTALDAALQASEKYAVSLVDQLAAGTLNTEGWQLAMMAELKMSHIAAIAAARGGWNRISFEDVT